MICGGTMSGNCATGSPRIATRPPMTVTMAMTIATMGRPMKNRDMALFPRGRWSRRRRGLRNRLRVDDDARLDLLNSLDDDALSGAQTLLDDPETADAIPGLDRPDFDLVARTDDGDLVEALKLRHCALGNEDRALLDVRRRANLRVLAGAQQMARVGEDPFDLDCARLHVHVAIGQDGITPLRVRRTVRKD